MPIILSKAKAKVKSKKKKIKLKSSLWKKPKIKPQEDNFYLLKVDHLFTFSTLTQAKQYYKKLQSIDIHKGPWLIMEKTKHTVRF